MKHKLALLNEVLARQAAAFAELQAANRCVGGGTGLCTCDQGACAELQRQGGVHRGLMDAGRRAPGRGEVTRSREASVLDQDAQVRLNLTVKTLCDNLV